MRSNRSFLVYFFLGSIILPCLILSWLAFRSIQNETLLAEKRSEDQVLRFRSNLFALLDRESGRIFQEIRKQALRMFDYPRTTEELESTPPLKEIAGLRAIFLFSGNRRVFPFLGGEENVDTKPWLGTVDSLESQLIRREDNDRFLPLSLTLRVQREKQKNMPKEARVHNRVGILRDYFRAGNYLKVLELSSDLLSSRSAVPGLLSRDITPSLWLLQFRSLIRLGQNQRAIEHTRSVVETFFRNPSRYEFTTMEFLTEEMFNTLLSLENISPETRESLWNTKHNLVHHLESSETFRRYRSYIIHLHQFGQPDTRGLSFVQKGNLLFFRMVHPFLRGTQRVMGLLDLDVVYARLFSTVKSQSSSWGETAFTLAEFYGDPLLQVGDVDSLVVALQTPLPLSFPNWNLTIYQRPESKVRSQSMQKVALLYGLLGFSLVILVLGSGSVLRGVSSEKKLITMKSNFLSVVTHELKTPLTSIKMFAEMLQRGRTKGPEKVAQYSGLIGKESRRLESLIEDILNYTRLEQGDRLLRKEKIDLGDFAERVVLNLQEQATLGEIRLQWNLERNTWIQSDNRSLHSMIQNLVSNAVKYTLPGGEVTVRVFARESKVIFEVEDNGVGILPSEIKNIFKDFYRVGDEMTRSTKGTGLGLAIVKRTVEAHRAEIQVESAVGKGSIFKVIFKQVKHERENSGR